MKKSVITFTFVMCLCAIVTRADTIVISFSGSGLSGTIAPGEPWSVDAGGTHSWGSPGPSNGQVPWPGSPTPGDITDFTITFTHLPGGVTIDPASLAAPQGCNSVGATLFCSFPITVQWVPTLSNGNDTITFEAPTGISLNSGNNYFVNIFFTGDPGSVTFTGGWSVIPEPTTYSLLGIGLLAIPYFRCRRTSR